MTLEMGKPVRAAAEEAEKCAWACRYYAEHGERDPGRRARPDRGDAELHPLSAARARARDHAVELSLLAGLPVRGARADGGQRRAAQARVQRAAVRARDRGASSGARALPRASSRRCSIGSDQVAPGARRRPRGGGDADRQRARRSRGRRGQAGASIKKTVLELGGSDPFIVMPSADLDAAVADGGEGAHDQQRPVLHRRQALHRRTSRSPTSSSAASSRPMAALRVGDPLDPDTEIGPLATPADR